jgi:hypothetical protein
VLQSFDTDVVTRPVSERKGAVTQAATYFQDSLGACGCGKRGKQRPIRGRIDVAAMLASVLV